MVLVVCNNIKPKLIRFMDDLILNSMDLGNSLEVINYRKYHNFLCKPILVLNLL
jgi:hypothetical protein